MKRLMLIFLILTACGCGCGQQLKPMTNDEVIAECKKCDAAGLKIERVYNDWTKETIRINCVPKKDK